ncbi:MAG: RidA family protein [Pseudomonadota bacterium]
MSNIFEDNLKKAGHTLPEVAIPVAKYLPYVVRGNRVTISGQISKAEDGTLMVGKLGETCDIKTGVKAAERCGLYIISIIKEACGGDLSKVKKIIKLGGYVNAAPDFNDHPQVINGASELMVSVFGEDIGMHARAAVGMSSLPLGVMVEIDAEVEIAG